jgi:hypothetical protein
MEKKSHLNSRSFITSTYFIRHHKMTKSKSNLIPHLLQRKLWVLQNLVFMVKIFKKNNLHLTLLMSNRLRLPHKGSLQEIFKHNRKELTSIKWIYLKVEFEIWIFVLVPTDLKRETVLISPLIASKVRILKKEDSRKRLIILTWNLLMMKNLMISKY